MTKTHLAAAKGKAAKALRAAVESYGAAVCGGGEAQEERALELQRAAAVYTALAKGWPLPSRFSSWSEFKERIARLMYPAST